MVRAGARRTSGGALVQEIGLIIRASQARSRARSATHILEMAATSSGVTRLDATWVAVPMLRPTTGLSGFHAGRPSAATAALQGAVVAQRSGRHELASVLAGAAEHVSGLTVNSTHAETLNAARAMTEALERARPLVRRASIRPALAVGAGAAVIGAATIGIATLGLNLLDS